MFCMAPWITRAPVFLFWRACERSCYRIRNSPEAQLDNTVYAHDWGEGSVVRATLPHRGNSALAECIYTIMSRCGLIPPLKY